MALTGELRLVAASPAVRSVVSRGGREDHVRKYFDLILHAGLRAFLDPASNGTESEMEGTDRLSPFARLRIGIFRATLEEILSR